MAMTYLLDDERNVFAAGIDLDHAMVEAKKIFDGFLCSEDKPCSVTEIGVNEVWLESEAYPYKKILTIRRW